MSKVIYLSGLLSVAFWVLAFFLFPFSEPDQLAIVGQFSPWKGGETTNYRWVSVGTSPSESQIVLWDYRASKRHAVFFSKGGLPTDYTKKNPSEKEILSVLNREDRKPSGSSLLGVDLLLLSNRKISIWQGGEESGVGQYQFKGGEVVSVPVSASRFDPCNPSELRRSLSPVNFESASPPEGSKSLEFQIFKSKFPIALKIWQPALELYAPGLGWKRLEEFSVYTSPGGEFELAFVKGRWSIREAGSGWRSLPPNWRRNWQQFQLRYGRTSSIELKYTYQLKVAGLPCYWEITPRSISGGLDLGRRARLYFRGRKLLIKSLGIPREVTLKQLFRDEKFRDYSVRITASDGTNISLNSHSVYGGDGLSVGGYYYRIELYPSGVGLFQERKPSRFFLLWPFPRTPRYSPVYPLPEGELSLVAGRTPLKGSSMASVPISKYQMEVFGIPSGPFVRIERRSESRYLVRAAEGVGLFYRDSNSKFRRVPAGGVRVDVREEPLFWSGGIFFKLIRPTYRGLSLFVALVWGAFALFGIWQFSLFVRQLPDGISVAGRLWLFSFPLAIFLNGLGLYVLSHLSLSSRGLNHLGFLDRQLFWSAAGVILFSLIINWNKILHYLENNSKTSYLFRRIRSWGVGAYRIFYRLFVGKRAVPLVDDDLLSSYFSLLLYGGGALLSVGILLSILFGFNWKFWAVGILAFVVAALAGREMALRSHERFERTNFKIFGLTVFLLAFVPILGLILPPLVHNRFFLKVPLLGTVKLSEFAIIPAIFFFARFLGQELFWSRYFLSRKGGELGGEELFWKRIRAAFFEALFYFLLLVVIGSLYTVQGDLGPGLIFTLSFSLFLIYSSLIYSRDKGVFWANLIRVGAVFFALSLLFLLPFSLAALFPEFADNSRELQKILQRVQLWHQPWRYIAGEQLLLNLWNLTGYGGGINWFPNLHSDFIFTAAMGLLGPFFGLILAVVPALFAIIGMFSSLALMPSPCRGEGAESSGDETLQQFVERRSVETADAVAVAFVGLYLFSQNAVHLGSVLGLTPMTGVTYTWVSSGGSNLIACYLLLAISMRIFRRMARIFQK